MKTKRQKIEKTQRETGKTKKRQIERKEGKI
jgi:hypothetical protein